MGRRGKERRQKQPKRRAEEDGLTLNETMRFLLAGEAKIAEETLTGRAAPDDHAERRAFLREEWGKVNEAARAEIMTDPSADAHVALAVSAQFLGRAEEADAAYAEAMRIAPEDEELRRLKAAAERLQQLPSFAAARGEAASRPRGLWRRLYAWWLELLLRLTVRMMRLLVRWVEPGKGGKP